MNEEKLHRDALLVQSALHATDFRITEKTGKIRFGLGDIEIVYDSERNKVEIMEDIVYCATIYLKSLQNRLKQVVTDFYRLQKETFN